MITPEMLARLQEVSYEISELIDEAASIVKASKDASEIDRAEGYWIPHLKLALSRDPQYLGGLMITMDDTIKALSRKHRANDILGNPDV